MLKSEHQSQHYRLEDDLLKRFPEQIASATERIAGIEKDIAAYAVQKEKTVEVQPDLTSGASASAKFPGMVISEINYSEKEPAAKALLEACKGVKGRLADLPVGEYMGFGMSLRYESFAQQINLLLLRGAMTYQIELGTDALGNITRINNALDKLHERLDGAKSTLENLNRQVEAAKLELAHPFEQETELAEKEARLALLNADLNIDGDGEFDVLNDADERDEPDAEPGMDSALADYDEDEPESGTDDFIPRAYYGSGHEQQAAIAKSKPSILDGIRSFDGSKHTGAPAKDKPAERAI
jgi:hypothetical protein